ncbi:PaaX family transcriptional regulator C-terminal domain-containing protein [Sulfitobacter sp. LCG007]
MSAPPFSELVSTITGDQPPRVWSLLVTVFGDLARQEKARIGGPVITQLTELMGIKPEATRVALHRLRKDGWIESRRNGRSSGYRLTPLGREQSDAASPRIYGTEPPVSRAWMIITDPREAAGIAGVQIAPAVWMAAMLPAAGDTLTAEIDSCTELPGWIRARLCNDDLCAQSIEISVRCEALLNKLAMSDVPGALEVAALRVLIVHGWRRLALRTPVLPDFVFPETWRGVECRQLVAQLLAALPAPPLDALERAVAARQAG